MSEYVKIAFEVNRCSKCPWDITTELPIIPKEV